MGRIRSIKPEFPHSESMGRVSRDARLLFIEMWTLADDAGRLRGNPRMLAGLLFPYDDDAPQLINDWIYELDREGCIVRYDVLGRQYIQICNWLSQQKIDKPSVSKLPPFDDGTRILSKPRESYPLDQGEEGIGEEGNFFCANGVGTTEPPASSNGNEPTEEANGNPGTASSYPEEFEQFWSAYPNRTGRKRGKQKSYSLWRLVRSDERPAVLVAARNFAASKEAREGFARDPERFLAKDWWRDWLEEDEPESKLPTKEDDENWRPDGGGR